MWLETYWPYLVAAAGAAWGAYREYQSIRDARDKSRLEKQKGTLEVGKERAEQEKDETEFIVRQYRQIVTSANKDLEALRKDIRAAQEALQKALVDRASAAERAAWLERDNERLAKEIAGLREGERRAE
jgi:chromosome segregation ATPase